MTCLFVGWSVKGERWGRGPSKLHPVCCSWDPDYLGFPLLRVLQEGWPKRCPSSSIHEVMNSWSQPPSWQRKCRLVAQLAPSLDWLCELSFGHSRPFSSASLLIPPIKCFKNVLCVQFYYNFSLSSCSEDTCSQHAVIWTLDNMESPCTLHF